MKPAPFSYHAPTDLDEAIATLVEEGAAAKLLAGGQSLGPLLNLRLASPSTLVDLNRIPDLSTMTVDEKDWIRIGAMTRQRNLERSEMVATLSPLWTEAVRHVGHASVRNRGTVGGSLCHADPNAELPAVALITGARMVLRGPDGDRTVDADDFFVTYLTTAAAPDEVLREIRIPPSPRRSGSAWVEFSVRHGDFPIVGVAVALDADASGEIISARAVLAGVAGRPVTASPAILAGLCGQGVGHIATDVAAEVAGAIGDETEPNPDLIAGPDYKRRLVRHLSVVAIKTAESRVATDE